MKRLIPIHVESHSGYKVDEYPKCFYREGKRFDILEITDRWYQTDRDPESPAADYFKVITADDQVKVEFYRDDARGGAYERMHTIILN